MSTGENEQGLRKIIDLTRFISITLLILHFYFYCYGGFARWELVTTMTDQLMKNIYKTGLFSSFNRSKFIALGFLLISLIGAKGKKQENLDVKSGLVIMTIGIVIYFLSALILLSDWPVELLSISYMLICSIGFILTLTGGTLLSRVIQMKLHNKDIFNRENETFPQEERLLENEYSINLPAEYHLKRRVRKSWINIINPFRGILVCGTPGSGKSYFVIRHIITQHIQKGFTLFVYDFKYDDLTKIVYNAFLENKKSYSILPKFYIINFDDLNFSHRCNPLDPASMLDITDAAESASTILLGLNRDWVKKQGDFFVESAINFLTAVIWFLKKYNNGEFCTLPHVIELMQTDYDKLFAILKTEGEIEVLINPFISAHKQEASNQLEGQIASAKIALARLSSPQLYYVLSGNDFTLDINNPKEPKILCAGNNPQKIQIYGAVLSLYVNRLLKLVNQKGKQKCSLVFDEFPTIFLNNIDGLIATARSNKVSTTLGIQDFSQLRKDYGKEQADVITNIIGNVISGQVTGDTAKQLSGRFGKIMQDRSSLSINRMDTSLSRSKQLEYAIPQSTIATLSAGEFVGVVADDPDNKIALKLIHSRIVNDHEALKKKQNSYRNLEAIRKLDSSMIQQNYLQIKQDIQLIIQYEMERLLNDSET